MLIRGPYRQSAFAVALLMVGLAGCSPFRDTVPASCISPGFFDATRSSREPINFIRLRQDPPPLYLLGPRDVVGIYIEGVLGASDVPPPVHFPEEGDVPPAIGYPMPIREDGTLSLPLVPPIRATGLTIAQLEEEVRKAYTIDREVLRAGQDRIIVTLMEPRTYSVMVIREDVGSFGQTGGSGSRNWAYSQGELRLGTRKSGRSHLVKLRAYENDVLHALTETGGLPGVDAKNEVTVLRGGFDQAQGREQYLVSLRSPEERRDALANDPNVIKIPLRVNPSDPQMEWSQESIILNTGDIIFIESREAEVFYTGGLIKGGQFPLPRDYDLDVLGAIAMAGGNIGGAAGSGSLFGMGRNAIIPPSRLIVLRMVDGRQIAIETSTKLAGTDPQERILIQPNDFILLEYTPCELMLNILLNNVQINYFLNQI